MKRVFVYCGLVLVVSVTLASCSARPTAPVHDLSREGQTVDVYRVVRSGDTLYSLSWAAGVDFRELAAWNALAAPYTIYPGQRIALVPTGRKPAATVTPSSPEPVVSVLPRDTQTPSATIEPSAIRARPVPEPSATTPSAPASASVPEPEPRQVVAAGDWIWPVSGRVINDFSQTRGVDIAVAAGTPVKASAGGLVVYAGSGLRGYGQLIIVKHNNEYLSAYGHNRKLLVQEGDSIVAGQVIAESGNAPGQGELVHFEIRRNGQPVDPVGLLPRRS
jgi:lipoprotein NlpD